MNIIPNIVKSKRHLCASGSILLPLAQKWGLVGVAVAALSAFATQSVSAASLTVEIPTNPLTVNVFASGGFSEASGKVSVKGDAYWGYVLSIQSKNGKNVLTSKEGNTISSITGEKSKTSFPDNAWGYKFGKDNADISNNNFQPGPTTKVNLDATDASGDHNYTFTIGAKVNANQPAGNYSNTFIVTAIAEAVDYNIIYDCKEGATCPNQAGKSTEQSITLNSPAPTREGYEFQGYCTKEALSEKLCTSNSGTKYNPGDTYTLAKEGNNTMTLYAMWKPTTMQTFGNYCGALETEKDILTLTDVRDNNTYTIAKLKDDKCWMTQNLAIGSNEGPTTLTASDTDLDPDKTIDGESKAGVFTLPKGTQKAGAAGTADDGGWNNAQYNTVHLYINPEKNYGGYYSWLTATATEGTADKQSPNDGETYHSICPKGWRLPTPDDVRIFSKHYNTAEIAQQPPVNLVMSGFCSESACPYSIDGAVHWWTSTASTVVTRAYVLSADASPNTLILYNDAWKGRGRAIRCVAREEME